MLKYIILIMSDKKLALKKKRLTIARVYITTKRNNTHVTITDITGSQTVYKKTCGSVKTVQGHSFKNSKKSKPGAAQVLLQNAGQFARDIGISFVKVIINGVGLARESAQLSCLFDSGLQPLEFVDETSNKHGGCKSRGKPSK